MAVQMHRIVVSYRSTY